MKISVIYVGLWNSWDFVWQLLDQAKAAGISYTAFDYFTTSVLEMKKSEDCDGYIYLDIYPTDQSKPFAWIFEDDTDAAIVQKIQGFAKHIKDGHIQKIPVKEEAILAGGEQVQEVTPDVRDNRDDVRDSGDTVPDANINSDMLPDRDTGNTCVEVPSGDVELTEDEVGRLCFRRLVVGVDGQEVELSVEDIVTLSKMYKVMKEYGYKIKKLVL